MPVIAVSPSRTLAAVVLVTLAVVHGPGRSVVSAHDLERTQILVTFNSDGTYLIDVMNDPDWLLERVEPFSGLPLSGRLDAGPRDRRLVELEKTFAEKVNLYFDDQRIDISAEYIPPDPRQPVDPDQLPMGTMRLQGRVPEGAATFRWSYGLVIDPYPMMISEGAGDVITHWVYGEWDSDTFELAALTLPSRLQVVGTYLDLGFTHILPKGLDHILFVIGIYLLSSRLRPILAQVTTFTVAHTITLGLTIYGILSLPSSVVEPLIALSIAYVAIENIVTTQLTPWRIGFVFAFGLLHGMGFAGVLSELGLPRSEFMTALVSFNLGVEGGQLAVITMMFVAVGWLRHKEWYRRRAVVPLSVLIACVGVYWTVTRIAGS